MNGSAAKQFGTPALAKVSLQIELPYSITPLALGNGPYRKVLGAFLREAIPYLSAR
jgi:hypothetical protein